MFLTSLIHGCSGAITSGEASGSGQAASSSLFGGFGGGALTFVLVGGFVLLAAASTVLVMMWAILRDGRPQLASIAQLSPDGRYWWDGTSWHDGVVETPPQFVRSADGAYLWDGRLWRPSSRS
jgi:hypothetical protein